VPQAGQGAAAAGIDSRLHGCRVQHRVVARRQRIHQVTQRETHPFGICPVQVGVRDDTLRRLRGRQVGLHDAAQQRIARPARVGEPVVPPGRLNLRTAHRDAGHLAQQLTSPPGHEPGPGGERRRQPQAGAARVHPAQRAEDRIGEQQVQRRGRGICRR
jgi:hypothetical protein